MKIGNPAEKAPPAPLANGPAATHDAKAPAASSKAPDASAQVALSSTASTLMTGSTDADFDADKVARITQAIADGSFKINAEVIADKLIANAQEVLSKAQH